MLLVTLPAICKCLSNYTNYSSTLLLKTHSLHFPLEYLCLFYDRYHSSTAGQGVLIESLMRYYLFIFHKHLPLHSSFPANSVLWGSSFGTVKALASLHRKLGK